MQGILIHNLYYYIKKNNPDLLMQLEADGKVTEYLSNKISTVEPDLKELANQHPSYVIEELCMQALIQELRPSKYNYICSILQEEFETIFHRLVESGTLKFEVINMLTKCEPIFDLIDFTEEQENNRQLRYAIIGTIGLYLESNK